MRTSHSHSNHSRSGSSGTNFPPTSPLSTVSPPFKSLLAPFFSSFCLPWFYWRRSVPLPLLVWSTLLVYHSLSSQDILPLPASPSLFLSFSLSLISPPPPSLSAVVWRRVVPVNSISFPHFNTLPRAPSRHAPTHTDDNVSARSSASHDLEFVWMFHYWNSQINPQRGCW